MTTRQKCLRQFSQAVPSAFALALAILSAGCASQVQESRNILTLGEAPTGTALADQSPRSSVSYDRDTATFRGSKTAVIQLALRAIREKGWKIENANEGLGLVSFETTMSFGSWTGISATLMIEEASPGAFHVSGTAKQNTRGGQIAAFDIGGEAESVVREAVAKMQMLSSK